MKQNTYYVNIYMANRAFGGCEEGGWYYDVGMPIDEKIYPEIFKLQNTFVTESEAYEYQYDINEQLEQLNKDYNNYPPYSVLCDGYFIARVEEKPGSPYPEVIPHYE